MLGVAQWSPGEHRHGHESGLHNVDAAIEAGAAGGRRHRDTKLFPVPLGRVTQLLDSGPEHVIGDAHFSVREHDALGRDGAMREIAALAMQLGKRIQHFLEEEYSCARGNRLAARRRARENVGKPGAAGQIVDEADRRDLAGCANDIADREERRMIEFFDEPQALVQRELERRHRGQLGPNQQTLVRGTPVRVANQEPVAKPIPEKKVFGRRHHLGGRHVHNRLYSGIYARSRSVVSGLKSPLCLQRPSPGRDKNSQICK